MDNFFSNTLQQILSKAITEIIGEKEYFTFLSDKTNSFDRPDREPETAIDAIRLFAALEKNYGKKGALGIATKIGEASHRHFFRLKGREYQINSNDYRLMTPKKRYHFGLEKIAYFISENSLWEVNVINNKETWVWQVVEDKQSILLDDLWVAFLNGYISEYLVWTSGGRFFVVQTDFMKDEKQNICQIVINKKPLGN